MSQITCHKSHVTNHKSHVPCHKSHVPCHKSQITCHKSSVKFVAIVAHPFNKILNEDVLVKAVHQEPNVGVAI